MPKICIIEGIIGSGKTTITIELVKHIAKATGAKVCAILEPVEQWRVILPLFYKNTARYAYSLQTFVFVTRIKAIQEVVAANPDADYFILERSPFSDTVFFEILREHFQPVELSMYAEWIHTWRSMLPIDLTTAKVIYLNPSIECAMSRVISRNRHGEISTEEEKKQSAKVGVTQEYQAKLKRAHDAYILRVESEEFPNMMEHPIPIENIINIGPELADGNFRDDSAEKTNILNTILSRLI